ncbi:sensor histidine kinase [Lachnoanaerobaculum orale]|uniref:histidine kinase n=1 Tax=Lachnoanaerobaculum orale TaxID=979627 RepID=A0A3P3Q3J2_9FIRM|nr:sensor histidine kinase [Lachnoanaerobaculum orale]RRJ15811.1 sensor histidine kinase [Lachnoanaerobaculum orale]
MNKKISFKEELKRSLIVHALTPCFILCIICVLGFILIASVNIYRNNNIYSLNSREKFESVLNSYIENTNHIANDINIEDFQSDKQYKVDVIEGVYNFLNQKSIKAQFYIFDNNLDILYSTERSEDKKNFIKYQVTGSKSNFLGDSSNIIYIYGGNGVDNTPISSYLIVKPIIRDDKFAGVCTYELELKNLDAVFNNTNSTVLLVNKFHRVLFSNSRRFVDDRNKIIKNFRDKSGIAFEDGELIYISKNKVAHADTWIYVITDCSIYLNISIIMLLLIIAVTIIMSAAISSSAGKFSAKKTAIIYQLIDALKQVEDGKLDINLNIESDDEFKSIGHSFNMMLGSIRHLIERHDKMALENNMAIVQMMESQFNPHFLFNTLESIRYLVKFNPKVADKTVVNLSKLLRYSIQNTVDTVRFKEEFDFVKRYIEIMKVRFGERLEFNDNISDEVKGVSVPKMIIQPIVENAVKYGFGEDVEVLRVEISAYIENEKLYIIVKDDGVGIEEDLLKDLVFNLKEKYNSSDHIGLYNVHKRIELLYGTEYGLEINSETGKGTEVVLVLPEIFE